MGGETPQDATPEGDTGKIGKKKKKIKISMPEINVKEDIDALVEGEELSEEFKTKASTIFEVQDYQKVMEIDPSRLTNLKKSIKPIFKKRLFHSVTN